MTIFSVDLGPQLRKYAEKGGTKWLDRPMHIGTVRALLTPGQFEFRDVVIEGLKPTDRPFLVAKSIKVSLPWWTAISRHMDVDSVEMTDWTMVIESFPEGKHNFPRVKGPPRPPRTDSEDVLHHAAAGGRVARSLHLRRSHDAVEYRDSGDAHHAVPSRGAAGLRRYRRFRRWHGASVQTYEPFGASMKGRFSMNNGKVHFDRMDLLSDGAETIADGDVYLDRWPEQFYRMKSKIDIATQKSIFFHNDKFEATGAADFDGTFHYFKGGRELKGTWKAPSPHVKIGPNNWAFSNLAGKVLWLPSTLEITEARTALYGGSAEFDYRILSLDQKSGPKRAIWETKYQNLQLTQLTDFLETRGIRSRCGDQRPSPARVAARKVGDAAWIR